MALLEGIAANQESEYCCKMQFFRGCANRAETLLFVVVDAGGEVVVGAYYIFVCWVVGLGWDTACERSCQLEPSVNLLCRAGIL